MEYKSMPVKEAGEAVIKKIGSRGGNGGLIALDRDGNAAMPFNTAGMYRAAITKDGEITIFLYND